MQNREESQDEAEGTRKNWTEDGENKRPQGDVFLVEILKNDDVSNKHETWTQLTWKIGMQKCEKM